jgi:phage shock protein A
MGWLESFTLVMRSSITTLREKVEDPERLLYQLIVDMEGELERVRASVAGAIADEIQLGQRVEAARREAEQWLERAGSALRRSDEAAAKAALEQKVSAAARADALEQEYAKQKEQTARLHEAVRELADKIRQARQKQTLLLARLVRADSSQRIQQALNQATGGSAFAQFGRLEQRVERAEAMSKAYDRLDDRDPDAAELERQFQQAERQQQLAREFEELKSRVQTET